MHDELGDTYFEGDGAYSKVMQPSSCKYGLCSGDGWVMAPDGDGVNAHLEWCGCRPMPEANIGYCDENWNPISKEEWEAAQGSPWSL